MTVYVDRTRNPLNRMVMCHMLADTLDELQDMADRIGLKPEWFQFEANTPHYDVSVSKRALALKHGAVDASREDIVRMIRKYRIYRELYPNGVYEFTCRLLERKGPRR